MTTARVAIQTHDFNVADEIETLRRCPPRGHLRLWAAGQRKTATRSRPWSWSTTPA